MPGRSFSRAKSGAGSLSFLSFFGRAPLRFVQIPPKLNICGRLTVLRLWVGRRSPSGQQRSRGGPKPRFDNLVPGGGGKSASRVMGCNRSKHLVKKQPRRNPRSRPQLNQHASRSARPPTVGDALWYPRRCCCSLHLETNRQISVAENRERPQELSDFRLSLWSNLERIRREKPRNFKFTPQPL